LWNFFSKFFCGTVWLKIKKIKMIKTWPGLVKNRKINVIPKERPGLVKNKKKNFKKTLLRRPGLVENKKIRMIKNFIKAVWFG